MDKKLLKFLLTGVLLTLVLMLLIPDGKREKPKGSPRDYAEIAESDTLRAVTEYNTLSFHVKADSLSGFYYELVKAFARDHGLQLSITPEMSFHKRLEGLSNGKYDLIAYGMLATSELKDSLLLTTPIVLNRQVLVQRKPMPLPADSTSQLKMEPIAPHAVAPDSSRYVKSQLDLAGKTLHIVKGSPSILRIHHLASEIADTIYIKEVERYGQEQLISMVAHGDIDYAVCDESIARLAADSLTQIDIRTAISFTQFYAWGVSKKSPTLRDSLNNWLNTFKEGDEYKRIYRKYFFPASVPSM